MKVSGFYFASAIVVVVLSLAVAQAFTATSLPTCRSSKLVSYGYVPAGFTPEEYKKFKENEAKQNAKKNLGGLGPRGFKSRSFQSFQEALERGETTHLLPVFNAKEKVKKGEIKLEDIPYMQRGGSWDNSDVKGARKMKWLQSDKQYAAGGYKKEQSVSIFGTGEGLDWTGTRARSRPPESAPGLAPKFAKNYKAPNVKDMKNGGASEDGKKKKRFGLF